MRADRKTPKDVGAYIAGFKPEVRAILRKMRATIRKAAPDAEETWRASVTPDLMEFWGVFVQFAFRYTGDEKWKREMKKCFNWFLGANDLN
ncbi:MAG: DUF1801 domain-containing protein, partial [Candidatus Aminicenantes bacterium]|nr:DUF1801 domain-containing protein [Candidatus Aminicenantes bacterium]